MSAPSERCKHQRPSVTKGVTAPTVTKRNNINHDLLLRLPPRTLRLRFGSRFRVGEAYIVKLVPKLALALSVGVFAVVAALTAWRVHDEIELFDQAARRDQQIIGVTAAAALLKTRSHEHAVHLVERVNASRNGVTIRYVSFASDARPEIRPLLPLPASELQAKTGWRQLIIPTTPDASGRSLVTYVLAPVVDDERGAIELSQPLVSRAEHAWKGVWSALRLSLAMIVAGGLTMSLIGARIVGRPVAELIAAARKIGEGDFNVLNSIRRTDEFGELARALRAMSVDLSNERSRAHLEMEARIDALEQLRHAERLKTLGQLASVLAHEIGTPLNVIAGHANSHPEARSTRRRRARE